MEYRRPQPLGSFSTPRRSATVPTSFQPQPDRPVSNQASNDSVETLYNHPSVKIVSFTAGSRPTPLSPGRGILSPAEIEPGSLSWSSQLERTIAVGAFQIYRAPGSVAFLRCGSALQPILPKSQCWCIDEQSSKFVLQIRRPNYWRIEVPVVEDEDIRRALLLRNVLDQILQFEKTPCPFTRTFTVELPERPQTPVKKRPWTPRKSSSQWPPTPITPVDMSPRTAILRRESSGLTQSPKPEKESPAKVMSTPEAPQKLDTAGEVGTDPIDTPTGPDVVEVTGSGVPEVTPSAENETGDVDNPEEEAEEDDTVKVVLEPRDIPTESIITPEVETPAKETITVTGSLPTEVTTVEAKPELKKRTSTLRFLQKPEITVPLEQEVSLGKSQEAEKQAEEAVSSSQGLPGLGSQPGMELNVSILQTDDTRKANEGVFESSSQGEDEIQNDSFEGAGLMRVRKGRITSFASRRAVTAPPQLTLFTSPPSKSAPKPAVITEEPAEPVEAAQAHSPTDSSDSFHSVQSWHSPITPLPPSPPPSNPSSPTPTRFPYPHENVIIARTVHQRDTSDSTMTPNTQLAWENFSVGGTDTPNAAPGLPSPQETESVSERSGSGSETSLEKFETAPQESAVSPKEASSPSPEPHTSSTPQVTSTAIARHQSIRHRATTSMSVSHHRALSPLPPAANLFTPRAPRRFNTPSRANTRLQAIRRIPSAVIHKTCEILLAPPSHLINLMLKVAARIAAGEWRGFMFGTGDEGERVDVRWDWSDTEDGALEGWEESDFDFDSPGRGRAPSSNVSPSKGSSKGKEPASAAESQEDEADPWKTPTEELGNDDWSRSWGVD